MASVIEIIASGILGIIGIKAVDVLPSLAVVAVDRVSIVISEIADAVDGIVLFSRGLRVGLDGILLGSEAVGIDRLAGSEVLPRSHSLRRKRQVLFCHSLVVVASRRRIVSEDEGVGVYLGGLEGMTSRSAVRIGLSRARLLVIRSLLSRWDFSDGDNERKIVLTGCAVTEVTVARTRDEHKRGNSRERKFASTGGGNIRHRINSVS